METENQNKHPYSNPLPEEPQQSTAAKWAIGLGIVMLFFAIYSAIHISQQSDSVYLGITSSLPYFFYAFVLFCLATLANAARKYLGKKD